MPELPEVETVARQLAPVLTAKCLRRLVIYDEKLAGIKTHKVANRRIERVCRLGKQLVLELSPKSNRSKPCWLTIHLRMTGRLIYAANSRLPSHPDKQHLRAKLVLDDGAVSLYDLRRFARIALHDSLVTAQPQGLDPTSRAFSVQRLTELLRISTSPLKPWLMRQDRLVGIGNIYASEICFAAGIHPAQSANTLNNNEIQCLYRATKHILRAAIKHCGTTFSDFQDSRGQTGGYVRYLKTYGRENEPCKACRTPILRIVQQQRSTYFCPQCQRR